MLTEGAVRAVDADVLLTGHTREGLVRLEDHVPEVIGVFER